MNTDTQGPGLDELEASMNSGGQPHAYDVLALVAEVRRLRDENKALYKKLQRALVLRFAATDQPRVVAIYSEDRDAPIRETAFAVGHRPTVGEALDNHDKLLAELQASRAARPAKTVDA